MSNYVPAINEFIKNIKSDGHSTKEISDTHHSYGMLYDYRMALFGIACKCFPELSFKSKKHFDEENDPMFNGDFVAGVFTPTGLSTFHFKLEHWDTFKITELERAPKYDGYSDRESFERIMSLLFALNDEEIVVSCQISDKMRSLMRNVYDNKNR